MKDSNIPVRYFAYVNICENEDAEYTSIDIIEVSESDFIEASADYGCTYERHTVRENGCDQIVLTAKNEGHPIP